MSGWTLHTEVRNSGTVTNEMVGIFVEIARVKDNDSAAAHVDFAGRILDADWAPYLAGAAAGARRDRPVLARYLDAILEVLAAGHGVLISEAAKWEDDQ